MIARFHGQGLREFNEEWFFVTNALVKYFVLLRRNWADEIGPIKIIFAEPGIVNLLK